MRRTHKVSLPDVTLVSGSRPFASDDSNCFKKSKTFVGNALLFPKAMQTLAPLSSQTVICSDTGAEPGGSEAPALVPCSGSGPPISSGAREVWELKPIMEPVRPTQEGGLPASVPRPGRTTTGSQPVPHLLCLLLGSFVLPWRTWRRWTQRPVRAGASGHPGC